MQVEKLRERALDKKTTQHYQHFKMLLAELSSKTLKVSFNTTVKKEVSDLNTIPEDVTAKEFLEKMEKAKQRIFTKLEKEHKIVPKHYYRNFWLTLGMPTIGIPLGVVFGILIGNIAMLAVGLPVGIAIGMAYGTHLDEKAKAEGRQLSLELQPK